jgi:hypothetical protein
VLISREVGETTNHLFPAAEDNRKPSLAFNLLKPFDMHGVSPLYLAPGCNGDAGASLESGNGDREETYRGLARWFGFDAVVNVIDCVKRVPPWHPSCFGGSQKHITQCDEHGGPEMMKFLVGAVAGALAMWYWGDELRDYLDNKTRDVRERAVEKLQTVEEKAGDVLDRAKEQVSSTLQAGQEAIRPRMS